VTLIALDRSVGSQQRKAVLVILHLLHRDIPSLHGVTLGAIRPHLPAVNVRVTICAILPHIREHGLDVALHAVHFLVHSSQRVICFVVVEFGHGADGAPTCRRVTVLTRDC